MMTTAKAFAPATVANLNCGFDIMALALDSEYGDEVEVNLEREKGINIIKIEGDGGKLPIDPKRNTVTACLRRFLEDNELKKGRGVSVSLKKNMPLQSGLGSSGASACAALFAVNTLLKRPLDKKQLIPYAMESEQVACGVAHADNVSACLLGGIVFIHPSLPHLEVSKITHNSSLTMAIFHPHISLSTELSRKVLPPHYSLEDVTHSMANAVGFVLGLQHQDHQLIRNCLEDDRLVIPYRAELMPHLEWTRKIARQFNALGHGPSGGGPSIFALCADEEQAQQISTQWELTAIEKGLKFDNFICPIATKGCRIL